MKKSLIFSVVISMMIFMACSPSPSNTDGTPIISVLPKQISISAEGGSKSVTIEANCQWIANPEDTWVSVSNKLGNAGVSQNLITIQPNSDTKERSTAVVVRSKDSTASQSVIITQEAYVVPDDGGSDDNDDADGDESTISVTKALSVEKDTAVKIEESTVVAVSTRSYIITDGKSYILAYKGSDPGLAIGDRVKVEATINIYYDKPQLSNPTATKVGHTNYTHPSPQTMDADGIQQFISNPTIKYVKMAGRLIKSGNYWNIDVTGSATAGSLASPSSAMCPDSWNGQMVEVLGYTLYVSTSNDTNYACVIATNIKTIEEEDDVVFYRDWAELPLCDDRGSNFQYVSHGDISVGGKSGQRNFTLCFDRKSKGAIWVAYPLHSCHRGSGNRTDEWEYDPKIPTQYQPRLYSSYGSYTRGHQLPSSSRNKTKDINRATFYFSNMTPQTSTFNSGVWARLEGSVQDNVCSDTLYVVSGAIFDGQHDSSVDVTTTDKSGNVCAVPSHYYKALLRTKKGNTGKAIRSINKAEDLQAIAILMKHVDYSTSLQSSDIISIEELEEITGVTFFPAINDAIEEEVKKQKNRSAWKGL